MSSPLLPLQVYISAPYAAAPGLTTERHVARAEALSQLAVKEGLAPVCWHSAAWRGAMGRSCELYAAGLRVAEALCAGVARLDGRLWVLELPSGESDRAALERRVFERAYLGKPRYTRSGDWWAWERAFQGQGLGKLWKSLLVEADRAERYRRELKASSHNGRSVTA